MIGVRNVFKSFGKEQVLRGISLDIPAGEVYGLLGPSGSGKTTMVRILAGTLAADSGAVTLDGVPQPNRRSLSRIGFMPQYDALYNDLSGLDNLRFFGRLYRMDRRRLNARIDDVLELTGLGADRKKRVSLYSGGMKKRLSLATALLHGPDVLLLDEPTVGIDPVLRRTIWEEFARLRAEGRTLVVTTHVMEEADRCDRAGLLYGGHLIASGEVGALKASAPGGTLEDLFFQAAR